MVINDTRWKGEPLDIQDVMSFGSDEQELTIAGYRVEDTLDVYCSYNKYISKIMKVVDPKDIEVLTVNERGGITSIRTTITKPQLSFRNKR